MGIVRGIIDWCDEKLDQAYEEKDERKAMGKAALSGAVEGFADAAVIFYVPVLICAYYWMYEAKKK